MTPFVVSWSGGKDGCLALDRMLRDGGHCLGLINMLDAAGERSRSHGLRPEVVAAQVESLGLPLLSGRAGWDTYAAEFSKQVQVARDLGAQAVVFGDIDLQDHRDWAETICAQIGLTAVFPIWQEARAGLVHEVLGRGFRARIVAVREDRLNADLLGRDLAASLPEIGAQGADLCGEEGEYHSVVVDGPLFRQPLNLIPGDLWREQGSAILDLRLA